MSDLTIDILCFGYVTLLVFVAYLLSVFASWKSESIRKLIHIFTSFIIIPCIYCVSSPVYKVALPFVFIFINTFAVLSGMVKKLNIEEKNRNIGLILYPIAVTLVVYLEAYGFIHSQSAISGILMLGLGDGAAALVGKKWGKHTFTVYNKSRRSLEGCFTMALVSALIVLFFTDMTLIYVMITAILVAFTEAFSPSSFDNISVPLVGAALVELFLF